MRKFVFLLLLLPIIVLASNGTLKGSGTSENPWQIEDYEDLKAIGTGSYLYNEHYALTKNIDASASYKENCADGFCSGFTPIGKKKDARDSLFFSGTLDGRNHIIRNLRIQSLNEDEYHCKSNIGFVYQLNGTLENIRFDGLHVIGCITTSDYVGSVAVLVKSGTLRNIAVTNGYVQGHSTVGGIVSRVSDGEISHVSFQGKVVGMNEVGGFVGKAVSYARFNVTNPLIDSSSADVDIVAYGGKVGGFAGEVFGKGLDGIAHSTSSGTIRVGESTSQLGYGINVFDINESKVSFGGFVGYFEDGTISHCKSSVDIMGHGLTQSVKKAGGFVGENFGTIKYSYSTGNVYGTNTLGGFVGANLVDQSDSGIVENSYALGSVYTKRKGVAAGFAGTNDGRIENVYSVGFAVSQDSACVSVCKNKGSVKGAYWNADISGSSSSDVGVGLTFEQMTHMSSFEGWGELLDEIYVFDVLVGGSGEPIWDIVEGETLPFLYDVKSEKKNAIPFAEPTASAKWTESPVVSAANDMDVEFFGRWTGLNSANEYTLDSVHYRRDVGDTVYYGYQIGYALDGDTIWGTSSYVAVPNKFEIATLDDLQKIGNHKGYPLNGHYTLIADIDASGVKFKPIGSQEQPFVGSFDGQGHVIKNLSINEPYADDVGLFAALAEAKVVNLVFENAFVKGRWLVGVVAGKAESAFVENVVSYGGRVEGKSYVGGLFGYLKGEFMLTNYSRLGSSGSVLGKEYVGGVVGKVYSGVLTKVYAESYVRGHVDVGGVVGENHNGTIKEIYSAGIVVMDEGGYQGGPIAGSVDSDYGYSSCYFDNDILSKVDDYYNIEKGDTARTTEQMMTLANYVGWDFENVWTIDEGKSYPRLKTAKPFEKAVPVEPTPDDPDLEDYPAPIDPDELNPEDPNAENPNPGDSDPDDSDKNPLCVENSLVKSGSSLKAVSNGSFAEIVFSTPVAGFVKLDVLDMRGKVVASKSLGSLTAGSYFQTLDMTSLNRGRYIVALRVNGRMTENAVLSIK